MSWMLDEKFENSMLNASEMLPDMPISISLNNFKKNRNQSKLRRILELDLKLVEEYLTSQLYSILQKLQKTTSNGTSLKYACMECDSVFGQNDEAWSCERCLLWYHKDCAVIFPKEIQRKQKFCLQCYTEK